MLLDPPYAAGAVQPTVDALFAGGWLAAGALVCVEHAVQAAPQPPTGAESLWARTYGGTALAVLRAR